MPAPPTTYVERLSVRGRWWAIVIAIAVFGSAELFVGFDGRVIAIVVAAIVLPTIAMLAWAGRTTLVVDEEGLIVSGQRMSFDDMESVEGLDAARTRLLLGPEADPAAKLFVRGYIREAVMVRPLRSEPVPYWLISTRHPQQVIAAVEQAARASRVQ